MLDMGTWIDATIGNSPFRETTNDDSNYNGITSQTENGVSCANWNGWEGEGNHSNCRNPNLNNIYWPNTWCFTSNSWGDCNICRFVI